ncbi:MAG: helix-turn-helix domain-containing protein [Firmicutes bacterium]|nr:helix-turn-helix domain-containing protein [Bacillota bacterium]
MSRIGAALRQARLARGFRQQDICRKLYISDSTLSGIEHGKQRLMPDVAARAARELDDPELYLAVAQEMTGGVMVPAMLDGPRVDLHRASVKDKTVEELSEAIEALAKARELANARSAQDLTEQGREQVRRVLHELVEAQTACAVGVAVLCRQYGISPAQVYREHLEELRQKGYVRKEGRAA